MDTIQVFIHCFTGYGKLKCLFLSIYNYKGLHSVGHGLNVEIMQLLQVSISIVNSEIGKITTG